LSYHPLANDTGGTSDDRRAEADRILKIIDSCIDTDALNERENIFIEQMLDDQTVPISPKQLFWLRDIKDKYL
jgi:hypothetical protein